MHIRRSFGAIDIMKTPMFIVKKNEIMPIESMKNKEKHDFHI